MATAVIDPKSEGSKSVLAVEGDQDSLTDELQVVDGSLLGETVDQLKFFESDPFLELVDQD